MSVSSGESYRSFESLGEELNPEVLEKIFMRLVDDNNASKAYYVVSGTGTGKSTLIPPYFLNFKAEDAEGNVRNLKIIVTVPTRIAVRSLYNTIFATTSLKDEDGKSLISEQSIGYAAEGEIVNEDADLRYVTTEHFLRKILRFHSGEKRSSLCDILIVDEVHTGTIANEIILQTWKEIRDKGTGQCPRLLLASANSVSVPIENVPRGEVSTHTIHRIEIRYENRLYDLSKNDLYRRAGEVAAEYVMKEGSSLGNVLVFLPGRAEIEMAKLAFEAKRVPETYTIPVEGNVSRRHAREMNGEGAAAGKQLVIFATNAAETSLTIKGLGLVVDTLTEKIMYCAPDESPILSTQYISKASSLQRRGRTGRMRNGIYHALTTEEGYNKLDEDRTSEITRVPLSQYILLLIRNKQDPRNALKRAGDKRLDASYRLLVEISAIALKEDNKYKLTEKGKFCSRLPLSVRTSSFVYNLFRRLKQQRESFSRQEEETKINVVLALTIAALIENFDSGYYIYAENVPRHEFFDEHFEQFVRDGSENSLAGRLAAWNLVLRQTLDSFLVGRNVDKAALNDMMIRKSEELHLAPYVNRAILRTLVDLRERAIDSGVHRDHLMSLLTIDVISESINSLLSDSFPRYQLGEKGSSYYLVGSEELKDYSCKQRGGHTHETIVAFSTIRIKIGDRYSDKISFYASTHSIGLRDNSARARRRLRNIVHPNESGEKVDAPETVASFDEIFGFSDTVDDTFKRKKKVKVNTDYLAYVDALLLDAPSMSSVQQSSKNYVMKYGLSCLPARYEDTTTRKDVNELKILERQLNLLRDRYGSRTIVILDPYIEKTTDLVLKKGVAFTSPYANDNYLGSIGRKEDIPPSESCVFVLTRNPDENTLTFLRERKGFVYSVVPIDGYTGEKDDPSSLYPFLGTPLEEDAPPVKKMKEKKPTVARSSSSSMMKEKVKKPITKSTITKSTITKSATSSATKPSKSVPEQEINKSLGEVMRDDQPRMKKKPVTKPMYVKKNVTPDANPFGNSSSAFGGPVVGSSNVGGIANPFATNVIPVESTLPVTTLPSNVPVEEPEFT